jgi:hypothetical protein
VPPEPGPLHRRGCRTATERGNPLGYRTPQDLLRAPPGPTERRTAALAAQPMNSALMYATFSWSAPETGRTEKARGGWPQQRRDERPNPQR